MTANPFQSRPISNRCVASAAIAAALGQPGRLTSASLETRPLLYQHYITPADSPRGGYVYVRKQGETRSGFLVRAALDAMRKLA